MEKLLLFLAKNIVSHPEVVKITQVNNNGFVMFNLSVHKDDMGRVIGKEGKVIKAMRNLLRVKAAKLNLRFSLELKEAD